MARRIPLSLQFPDWPPRDQSKWRAARRPAEQLLAEHGLAARWRPKTADQTEKGYGLWLGCLARNNRLDIDAAPAERLTPENIELFRAELAARVASCTVESRLRDLKEAIRVMQPGADLGLVRRALSIATRRAEPSRRKRQQMLPARQLFEVGIARMHRADREHHCKRDIPAGRYRDGLMIAFLASRAIVRLANLAAMRIGQHIERDADCYVCRFSGDETKNGDVMEFDLPAALTPFIERYLAVHRETLLRGHQSDAFWVSAYRGPLSEQRISERIRRATLEEVGISISPHRFRDCAATSVAEEDPAHEGINRRLLHHRDERSSTTYSINAGSLSASRRINAILLDLRAEALEPEKG